MYRKKKLFLLCTLVSATFQTYADSHDDTPYTIKSAVGLPDWLTLSVQHRSRYETFDNTFKRNGSGSDQVLAFRTQVFAEARYQNFRFGAEFIDSRVELDDAGTTLNNTLTNEAELLQAYVAWHIDHLLASNLDATVKFGRQTMDIGSRRLVARNRYRNTINHFNGIEIAFQSNDDWQSRSFVMLPVSRLPNDAVSLNRGIVRFDEENFNTLFAGTFFAFNRLALDTRAELYFFQLSEEDTATTASKNRHLSTPGLRWYRDPAPNRIDFELEGALQTGTSHASTAASDDAALEHFAYFGHAALGYTFDLPGSPRILAQYDYASGDRDPNDSNNGRFETLYGARRFEFGPTGIWGAFARANIISPGIRVQFKPSSSVSAFVAHRGFWLAEKRDTWVGGNLRDNTGQSGDFIGQQIEARLRWQIVPRTVLLETGWAHLFKGSFAKNAPGSPADKDDADYFYAQTSFSF